MPFQAGDVVVCTNTEINSDFQPNPEILARLKKGVCYRVVNYLPGIPLAGVQLKGIDHRPGVGWQAWRFRKLEAAEEGFIAKLRSRNLETA